ncbi:MAG: VTT domain-containing protein [Pseudomonadota bacterium]|nr:VTT domain-containing protein [Pseudomonadota bacterium]|tara:strand:+ start:22 stop:744 length:723 start_codon:yes stop_codon:yes gene_type:complete
MSKNLKIFLGISYLLVLIAFLYFIFSSIQISRLDDFSYYKEIQSDLDLYISGNIIVNLIYFFIFAIIWVALLGFGSPILIISGILFGQWLGTFISVISISFGALILYSIGSFFFSDYIKLILEKKFEKYIHLFQKNEFYYFFIYRFIGGLGIPFGMQNLIPILFRMKKINYFFSSLFGFIPGFFVINTIGAGLNNYIEQADKFNMIDLILTPNIYLPIFMFVVLMIISLLIKKNFFDGRN